MTSSIVSNKSKSNTAAKETFHGYIETTRDSLLLFEACKRGIIPRITKRLQDNERYLIRSGSVFCFDEKESGIKRWTDGLMWSPSRISGSFLIYRELADKRSNQMMYATDNKIHGLKNYNGYVVAPDLLKREREKALLGSLKSSHEFKKNGLIKKSMSLILDGVHQHIISYYSKEDVLASRLKTPSTIVELASLEVSPGLRLRQNFRIPTATNGLGEVDASDNGFVEDSQQKSTNKRKFSDCTVSNTSSSSSSHSSINSKSTQSRKLQALPDPTLFSQQSSNNLYTPMTHVNDTTFFPATSTAESESNNLTGGIRQLNLVDNYGASTLAQTGDLTSIDNILDSVEVVPMIPQYHDHVTAQKEQQQSLTNQLIQNSYLQKENTLENQTLPLNFLDNEPSMLSNNSYNNHPMNNITSAKSFSNTNYNSSNLISSTSTVPDMSVAPFTTDQHFGGGYHNTTSSYANEYYHQVQNPHQHLFSSSSFHAVNHASLLNRTEISANAFMLDMNMLLGTGWNEFELQM